MTCEECGTPLYPAEEDRGVCKPCWEDMKADADEEFNQNIREDR